MEPGQLRHEIAFAAAQLLNSKRESVFARARWRAIRGITRSFVRPECIPTDMEIRAELQQLVTGGAPLDSARAGHEPETWEQQANPQDARFDLYLSLLLPLDRVRQDRRDHPEGDVLYHSLQVFELVRESAPMDEDLLLAALLHDIGQGIDPRDPVVAALRILRGHISDRTAWLIENLAAAHGLPDGTIGHRARRRLVASADLEWIELLARCDTEGRLPGRAVCSAADAVEYVRMLSVSNEHT